MTFLFAKPEKKDLCGYVTWRMGKTDLFPSQWGRGEFFKAFESTREGIARLIRPSDRPYYRPYREVWVQAPTGIAVLVASSTQEYDTVTVTKASYKRLYWLEIRSVGW